MSTGMPYQDYCYMCAGPLEGRPRDDEHVIPANLFERGRKTKGLITLPAHRDCNRSFSMDDENFRLLMATLAAPYDPVARKVWEGPTMRGFHRPERPGLKKATLAKLHPVDVHTPAGIYLGRGEAIFEEPHRIQRVVNRMTRGLFAKTTGTVLPADWPVSCDFIDPEAARPYFERLNVRLLPVGEGGVFHYGRKVLPADEREGFFWMIIYGRIHFWGYTGQEIRGVLGVDNV